MSAELPSLGELLSSALWADTEQHPCQDERAQYLAALELSRVVAPLLRVGETEVFDVLCSIPDNMLPLLRSPEGWAALAAITANELGADCPLLKITIN